MVRFFGEVSLQKGVPPTKLTDVTSKSCEKTLVVCIKNTRTNNLKKYLISFLILISFNV